MLFQKALLAVTCVGSAVSPSSSITCSFPLTPALMPQSVVYYVHFKGEEDRRNLHKGVERDFERLRLKKLKDEEEAALLAKGCDCAGNKVQHAGST